MKKNIYILNRYSSYKNISGCLEEVILTNKALIVHNPNSFSLKFIYTGKQ